MAIALLLLLAAVAHAQGLRSGAPAPPLTLDRPNLTWESLRGRPVILEFWATWCGPCVDEIPHLNHLANKFPDVQFVSITAEDSAVVDPFLAKHPIAGQVALDHGKATSTAYGVEGVPKAFLIDPHGILLAAMHPRQINDVVVANLSAGRPVEPLALPRPLHFFDNTAADPVFMVAFKPSVSIQPGGIGYVDPGMLQGENLALKIIIGQAYEISQTRIEGPADSLAIRYDYCILLPREDTGERALLRETLERVFRLKVRRESREVDALVLQAVAPMLPRTVRFGPGIDNLAANLEFHLKRPVVNETGLTGSYDFEYPQSYEHLEAWVRQLGLELTPARRTIDVLVIESLEPPRYP